MPGSWRAPPARELAAVESFRLTTVSLARRSPSAIRSILLGGRFDDRGAERSLEVTAFREGDGL